jgi:hypothetical protein
MQYNAHTHNGGIEATFEGPEEVETVREAFSENAQRLISLGNDSSVSGYQKWVAEWTGSVQTYKGAHYDQLAEPLRYFVEATEEKADEVLDTHPSATRIQAAAKRYELGYYASMILQEMDQSQSGEAVSSID